MTSITLQPGHVSPRQLRQIHAGGTTLALAPGLLVSRATVQRIVDDDEVVYGINTDEPLAAPVGRLILTTKAVSLGAPERMARRPSEHFA
jgi:histidine ammonia-lyase